jgi:hypothetical protein
MPKIDIVPIGAALKIIPVIVKRKIENNFHASGESPFGGGKKNKKRQKLLKKSSRKGRTSFWLMRIDVS